jgi:hypothetical protein
LTSYIKRIFKEVNVFKLIGFALLFWSVNSISSVDSKCQIALGESVCANINFLEPISRKSDAKFEISFVEKKSGKIVQLDQIPEIKLWMVMDNGHGHGSAEVKIKQLDKKYLVENVWFLMLGQWSLKISGKYQGKSFNGEPWLCVRKEVKNSALGKCK